MLSWDFFKKLRWNILLQLLQQLNSHFNCLLRVVSVSLYWTLTDTGSEAQRLPYWIFCSQNQGNFPGITPKWIARLEPHLWSKVNFKSKTKFKSKQNWRERKVSHKNRSFREKGSKTSNPWRNVAGNLSAPKFVLPCTFVQA